MPPRQDCRDDANSLNQYNQRHSIFPMRKLIIGTIIAIVAVPLLLFAFVVLAISWSPAPLTGSHVQHLDWLPPTAHNISYYETKGFGWIRSAEFSISEEDFHAYARQNGWTLKEVTNFTLPASRFPDLSAIDGFTQGKVELVQYYEDVTANNGGLRIAFDPAQQRCHYSASHR